MLQVLRDTDGVVLAIMSDGDLVMGNNEVTDWFTNGVPSLEGVERDGAIVETEIRVPLTSPVFHLALLDLIEERAFDLSEVDATSVNGKARPRKTPAVMNKSGWVGAELREGDASGVNVQAGLPDRPVNPHDSGAMHAFLAGAQQSRGDVIVRVDPEIYNFRGELTEWAYPLKGAVDNQKVAVTGETVNNADENRANVDRLSRQLRDVPANNGVTKDPKGLWHPVQRDGKGLRPDNDADRTIESYVINGDDDVD